jgi:hypothetical protein
MFCTLKKIRKILERIRMRPCKQREDNNMTFANSYSYYLFYFMPECIGSSVLCLHCMSFPIYFVIYMGFYRHKPFLKITGHWDTLMQKWVTTIYVRKIFTPHGCNTVSGRINFILVMTKLLV